MKDGPRTFSFLLFTFIFLLLSCILIYNLTDHLGNVRATVTGQGEMVSKDAYFPFGKRIGGLSVNTSDPQARYKYNGKELDEEKGLNWLAYGARYYDPELGRWHVVDPSLEFKSSYLFVGNSVLIFKDPDGRDAEIANGIFGIPTGEFSPNEVVYLTLKFPYFKGNMLPCWKIDSNTMEKQLNSFISVWQNKSSKHYAPKVAEHLSKNTIDVGIYDSFSRIDLESFRRNPIYTQYVSASGARLGKNAIAIILSQFSNDNLLGSTLLHEIVHDMGFGEFGAYAADFAAGYMNLSDIISIPNWTDGFEQMERFENYFYTDKNGKTHFMDVDGTFEQDYKSYGNEIIGR